MQPNRLCSALLLGLAVMAAALVLATDASANGREKVIHTFQSLPAINPSSTLTLDSSGNLYGTTSGAFQSRGTVFKLTHIPNGTWRYSSLYVFKGAPKDGTYPQGALTFDAAGNLYGTTTNGGANNEGTVFELTPTSNGGWNESVLYSFGAYSGDGIQPQAGVIFDAVGNLYGTTAQGGSGPFGAVFKLTPAAGSWTESLIYEFGNEFSGDGGIPAAPLVWDAFGNLYGTTEGGGQYGGGTVFELTPLDGAWTETIIHSFGFGDDGITPIAAVTFDNSGNLYGTASEGGGSENGGIVFELSLSSGGNWTETLVHQFHPRQGDGGQPYGPVVFNVAGELGGTTFAGGSGYGTVFRLTPTPTGWTESGRYSFTGGSDGSEPLEGLILDSKGNAYGTTHYGGNGTGVSGYGVVFKIIIP